MPGPACCFPVVDASLLTGYQKYGILNFMINPNQVIIILNYNISYICTLNFDTYVPKFRKIPG